MICDICGGNLIMQVGAIAKCEKCETLYTTEQLREKYFKELERKATAVGTDQVTNAKPVDPMKQNLEQFFHRTTISATNFYEVKGIWTELGLNTASQYSELNKFINEKTEFEKLYGSSWKNNISELLEPWAKQYKADSSGDSSSPAITASAVERPENFVDMFCPNCGSKLHIPKRLVDNGSSFACPYCRNAFKP